MTLLTTTIGSFPKPPYVTIRDWFQSGYKVDYDARYFLNREVETGLVLATREVLLAQINAGIDVPTDGEQRRENYIYYHCRHLTGIDFEKLTPKVMRSGAWEEAVPTITQAISPKSRFLRYDWKVAQSYADLAPSGGKPVKITVPGPMTIADTLANKYYGDDLRLIEDLAAALNVEIRDLADAGCTWIQVDEPVFARYPEKALAYGIENLERCFHGVPSHVNRVVHLCCGYPLRLDQPDDEYAKADPSAYFTLADALDDTSIDEISIEDAHRHNDLTLLERFGKSKVVLGVVAIARTRVESVEEIRQRLSDALSHIDAGRLVAAPDCGLGMLDRATAESKLLNLVTAAGTLDC